MGTDPAAIALTVVEMARQGRFAEIEELFAPRLRALVGAEALRAAWAAEESRSGPVSTVGEPVSEPAGEQPVRVSVPVTCERGGLTVVMSVDRDGMLNGLRLAADTAPWKPPPYADPESFDEHDVTIGDGPLAVSGTMSLPRGAGPRPGVVLLGGGGPFDRDATAGANKPLKDLAWGLATRGIAVSRFDKVTHTHGGQVADMPGFTMADEYVPHAVAAVRLLRRQPGVDPARVFVLGHSMGGRAAPRVAAAETSVAGLVIMAGDTQPMHRAAVRVIRYLASLDPGPAMEAAVETFTRQAAMVADPGLSPSTPAEALLFGRPAVVLAGPARRRPGRDRGGTGQTDVRPPGRPRLSGDRRRRSARVAGRPRPPARCHHPRLRRRRPSVLSGLGSVHARGVRARATRGPGRRRGHRRVADDGRREDRLTSLAASRPPGLVASRPPGSPARSPGFAVRAASGGCHAGTAAGTAAGPGAGAPGEVSAP
ncbi:hypothetical protein GCM10018952_04810 [Streptosporangium vulgare]